jgi:hypothetical protein
MSDPYRPADFVQEIQSQYSTVEERTFWACEPFLQRFLAENVAEKWVKEQLGRLSDSNGDLAAWQPKETRVHKGEAWTLSLTVLDSPLRFIHAVPYLAFYAALRGELVVDRYKLPAGFRNDVFDPNVRVEFMDRVSVPQRQLLRLDSTQYAYDFQISEPLPVLLFTSRCLQPLEWLFSKTTLHAWQANDADLQFTQLRVATNVLGKIAHQTSLDPLLKLSHHSHHAVRWAAIQNMGRINRTAALSRVRAALDDPHPHVRRAAQKTVEQLTARTAK